MTVNDLVKCDGFSPIALPFPDRKIDGAYIGDLLSWVMGRAESGNAWITIMSNINVIAVATLTDVSCVILADGVAPDDELINLACQKGINILSTMLPMYEAAITLKDLI